MKKTLLVLLLAFALIFSAACSGNHDNNTNPNNSVADNSDNSDNNTISDPNINNPGSNNTPDEIMQNPLIDWMMSGTFYFDFVMIADGLSADTETPGSIAMDGDNMAIKQEMTIDGMLVKSWIVSKDEKMYIISEDSKTIMEMSIDMSFTEGIVTDYTGILKTGEGIGEVNGRTLPYEEYTESLLNTAVR